MSARACVYVCVCEGVCVCVCARSKFGMAFTGSLMMQVNHCSFQLLTQRDVEGMGGRQEKGEKGGMRRRRCEGIDK